MAPPNESAQEREKFAAARRRVWAAVLWHLRAEIAEWNRKFLPSDGRRIVLDEAPGGMLTLTTRSATVTAAMSLDGTEIIIVSNSHSGRDREWRDSSEWT